MCDVLLVLMYFFKSHFNDISASPAVNVASGGLVIEGRMRRNLLIDNGSTYDEQIGKCF